MAVSFLLRCGCLALLVREWDQYKEATAEEGRIGRQASVHATALAPEIERARGSLVECRTWLDGLFRKAHTLSGDAADMQMSE